MNALTGYKTYIVAVLLGVLAAGKYLGWVDNGTFEALLALLTGSGLAALRAAK